MLLKFSLPALAGAIASAILFTGSAFAAPTIVTVSLNNQSITTDLPAGLGMAMPGADRSKAVMSVTAVPNVVRAGEISFVATNNSTDYVHEMLLIKIDDPKAQLPFIADELRVDEEAAGHMGEVAELDPGKSGTLTLTLDPGTYMLFCNIPGHYMAGMWTTVTVQ